MRSTRGGTTLVELLIALALALFVVGVVVTTLTRQQRLFAALDAALQAAPRELDATTVMGGDVRTMFLAVPSLYVASDSVLELDAVVGASTLCTEPVGSVVLLPPRNGDFANTLTSWNTLPDSNDALLVYHAEGAPWERIAIRDIRARAPTGCVPAAAPYPDAAIYDAGPTYELTLVNAPRMGTHGGTPVRVVRHVRYSVYRASDALWYVGLRRCPERSVGCETVQPLAGPFPSGLVPPIVFRYFTGTGASLASGAPLDALVRVDVVLRRPVTTLAALWGGPVARDSTITSIALRNRP